MKVPRSILRALNVRRDEWWLVQKLFLLQFFQGAGITFFFTTSFSRFLEKYPISQLPKVFILSSFLLWITGFIYSKLEHRLSVSRLSILITSVFALSMIIFRVGLAFIDAAWFFYLMLAWYNMLYLLNNLVFWGMAAQLYDVRQSKRLFGVISAGDIPAKFIGYSVALVSVSYIGTANLLFAGLIFILASFPFLQKILKREDVIKSHSHETHNSAEVHSIVKDFTVNKLVRRVAILTLIVSACIVLINYAFYAEVKEAYHDDVALAGFIAMFLATARLVALLIKFLGTSRLVYWLGNRTALLITPTLLIILTVILLFTNSMNLESKTILYIFGLSAILTDVLRSAINTPVLLTMMQPLSTHERLRAHNIVKGIMDPFAYFSCGLLLLIALNFNVYSLPVLCIALVFLAIAWVIGIFRVHNQYLKTLIKTISSRFFSQEDFNFYDPEAKGMLEGKIRSGTELEVLYILKMLGSGSSDDGKNLIILALQHPSEKVVSEALRLISRLHIREAETELAAITERHPSEEVRSEAIKVFSKLHFRDERILPLMDSDNKTIRRSAIVSVLNHSHTPAHHEEAERRIKLMFSSKNKSDRKEAAHILCETSNRQFDEELIGLINEDDPSLQLAAIHAMGHHPSERCMEQMIRKIDFHENAVIESLIVGRERSLPHIKKRILDNKCSSKQKEKLINAIGRINGNAAHELLISLIKDLPVFRAYLLRVLYRCHYKANKDDQPYIESLIRDHLVSAAAILFMQKNLLPQEEKYRLMLSSLQLDLDEIRDSLLHLFGFIYDREKINKIKTAIELSKKGINANAIELVDMTVKKEFANQFNAAFESGDLEHRTGLLKNLFPRDIFPGFQQVMTEVLDDKKLFYNNWSKACSLYISKKMKYPLELRLVNKYLHDENLVLRETAGYAVQNN